MSAFIFLFHLCLAAFYSTKCPALSQEQPHVNISSATKSFSGDSLNPRSLVYSDQDERSESSFCDDPDSKTPGFEDRMRIQCVPITLCSENERRYSIPRRLRPNICGWRGVEPLVCCQNITTDTRRTSTTSVGPIQSTTAKSNPDKYFPSWIKNEEFPDHSFSADLPEIDETLGPVYILKSTSETTLKDPYKSTREPSSTAIHENSGTTEMAGFPRSSITFRIPYKTTRKPSSTAIHENTRTTEATYPWSSTTLNAASKSPLNIHIAPPPPPVEKTFPVYKICGKVSSSDKNGESNDGTQWPWLVSIRSSTEGKDSISLPLCVGVMISNTYVVTRASCILSIGGNQYRQLRLYLINGQQRRPYLEDNSVVYDVDRVKFHPFYGWLTIDAYDIALLRSKSPVKTSVPICLPDAGATIVPNDTVKFVSVNIALSSEEGSISSVYNQEVELLLNQECHKIIRDFLDEQGLDKIPDSVICATLDQSRQACSKIAGSILMTKNDRDQWMLIGLNGHHTARGCYRERMPLLLSAVMKHLDWISANTNLS